MIFFKITRLNKDQQVLHFRDSCIFRIPFGFQLYNQRMCEMEQI